MRKFYIKNCGVERGLKFAMLHISSNRRKGLRGLKGVTLENFEKLHARGRLSRFITFKWPFRYVCITFFESYYRYPMSGSCKLILYIQNVYHFSTRIVYYRIQTIYIAFFSCFIFKTYITSKCYEISKELFSYKKVRKTILINITTLWTDLWQLLISFYRTSPAKYIKIKRLAKIKLFPANSYEILYPHAFEYKYYIQCFTYRPI